MRENFKEEQKEEYNIKLQISTGQSGLNSEFGPQNPSTDYKSQTVSKRKSMFFKTSEGGTNSNDVKLGETSLNLNNPNRK